VELQVKAQSNSFICDQKDEIDHRYSACGKQWKPLRQQVDTAENTSCCSYQS